MFYPKLYEKWMHNLPLRKENDNHLNSVLKEAIQSWASDFHLTSIDSNSDPGNEQQ